MPQEQLAQVRDVFFLQRSVFAALRMLWNDSVDRGIDLAEKVEGKYDAVIVAVSHDQYAELSEEYFKGISTEDGIVVDIKGIYRNKIKSLSYWSL